MGKYFRDEYLRDKKLRVLDFMPQVPYNVDGLRKGTHDYYMFFPGGQQKRLGGATKALKQLRKIIVEIHGNNLERVREILESNNFTLEIGGPAGQYVTGIKQGL